MMSEYYMRMSSTDLADIRGLLYALATTDVHICVNSAHCRQPKKSANWTETRHLPVCSLSRTSISGTAGLRQVACATHCLGGPAVQEILKHDICRRHHVAAMCACALRSATEAMISKVAAAVAQKVRNLDRKQTFVTAALVRTREIRSSSSHLHRRAHRFRLRLRKLAD